MKHKRPFIVCDCGDHAAVALTRGYVALVSPKDVAKVEGRNWCAKVHGRSIHAEARAGSTSLVKMHRAILDAEPGQDVDHINGDGIDNRRANLRSCNQRENSANQRTQKRAGKSSAV